MEKQALEGFISAGLSTHEIAKQTGMSQTNVRWWLSKYELQTHRTSKVYLCRLCGESDKAKFVSKGSGRLSYSRCKACHNKSTIERTRELKAQAVAYKGGKCEQCGYDRCLGSLHFHHADPSSKDPDWRKMRLWKFDKIKKELDKCQLLCGNCHGEVHWEMGS